jgi:aryl-alcohol dehydrogenase-like predicted oxidoreductase
MRHDDQTHTDRRAFLQTSAAVAAAVGLAGGSPSGAQDPAPAPAPTLPTRPLGKTGASMTLLDIGTGRGRGVGRLLRHAYRKGIRAFDTSATYQSEPDFKAWFEQEPAVRKELFLVSKDAAKDPGQVSALPSRLQAMVDARCEAMGTDYLDLFFIHSFGDLGLDPALALLKGDELRKAADAVKASGKLRHFGISTHHRDRAQILQTAADTGFIDAIMVQYSPWLEKDSPLNRALDACHDRGIGLISMKQVAGRLRDGLTLDDLLADVQKRVPTLAERKLSPFQGLLQAIWTDERIASACVAMQNTDHIDENSAAAQSFEPLKAADLHQLRDAVLAHRSTLCSDCDGRCSRAAGTEAALGDLTRYLTYHEHHGDRAEARRLYASLPPEARDWATADLTAARDACPNHLDFASLLPEVERRLA